ncbi:hypothetical protein evm_004272 [Chilo suppressalis]|nr:hypothetical protein evm_004272 [Chilo suppressalis]
MQLYHEHNTVPAAVKMNRMQPSSEHIEVKEKRSSSASLRQMNPVASGDNMAVMNSAHKLKEELPPLVPCCEGKELQINEDLVRSGLSAISVKHDSVIQCLSMPRACERMQVPPGLVKHRNSFRSLHRPDLKRVHYLRRLTPDELEILFRGYSDTPARGISKMDNRSLLPPPDENIQTRDQIDKEARIQDEVNAAIALHPIPETRSGAEDVPAGMRLHGARARLYTSVLAGARAGDQLDGISANEEYDTKVPDEPLPEDEVQLTEELQIILPPRCDDITAESSNTTTSTES